MRTLIKIAIAILLPVFILSGCDKESDELPPSLKAEVAKNSDCVCLPYLDKYSWRGQIVFVHKIKGPTCYWFPLYYDRNGLRIEMEAGYTFDKFTQDATLIKLVWECKEFIKRN